MGASARLRAAAVRGRRGRPRRMPPSAMPRSASPPVPAGAVIGLRHGPQPRCRRRPLPLRHRQHPQHRQRRKARPTGRRRPIQQRRDPLQPGAASAAAHQRLANPGCRISRRIASSRPGHEDQSTGQSFAEVSQIPRPWPSLPASASPGGRMPAASSPVCRRIRPRHPRPGPYPLAGDPGRAVPPLGRSVGRSGSVAACNGQKPGSPAGRLSEREPITVNTEGRRPGRPHTRPDDPRPRNLRPAAYDRAVHSRAVPGCGPSRSGTGIAGITIPARPGRHRRARRAARRPGRRRCARLPARVARSRRRCGSPEPAAHSCGSR